MLFGLTQRQMLRLHQPQQASWLQVDHIQHQLLVEQADRLLPVLAQSNFLEATEETEHQLPVQAVAVVLLDPVALGEMVARAEARLAVVAVAVVLQLQPWPEAMAPTQHLQQVVLVVILAHLPEERQTGAQVLLVPVVVVAIIHPGCLEQVAPGQPFGRKPPTEQPLAQEVGLAELLLPL